jgi:hypothetical protein
VGVDANRAAYRAHRFFFFAGDRGEPVHVHVERADSLAKFWLEPVRLERSGGFNARELRAIQRIIEERVSELRGAWDDYFQG